MCGVTALMEFGPLKGNLLLPLYLSAFFPVIGPSLYIILHLMSQFWTQTSESMETPHALYSSLNTCKDREVPQDVPRQSVTTDSLLPAYLYDVCKLQHSGSQPCSLVITRTCYLCLSLSLPGSSFLLHMHCFFPLLPTQMPLLVSLCSQHPSCWAAAVISPSPQPGSLDWTSMGTVQYLASIRQEYFIQGRIHDECTASKFVLVFPLRWWVRIS